MAAAEEAVLVRQSWLMKVDVAEEEEAVERNLVVEIGLKISIVNVFNTIIKLINESI